MMTLVSTICFVILAIHVSSARDGFFNIGHMTNTPQAIDWAIGQGANGLEVDMGFDGSGNPTKFQHGSPCDCTCMPRLLFPNSVCRHLHGRCSAQTSIQSLFNHIANRHSHKVALLVIDSKIDGKKMGRSSMVNAARRVVNHVKNLYSHGYRGKVIVGAPKLDALAYIQEVAHLARDMPSVHFTIDLEKNNIEGVLKALVKIPNKNRVYGTGISACWTGIKDSTYRLARDNKNNGVVGLSYLWTIDKTSAFKKAINYFGGIMTNYPGDLRKVLRNARIGLATPSNARIPPATSNVILHPCDCNYHPGGCSISKAPPPGRACRCIYVGVWTCKGSLTSCRNPSSTYCKRPTKSVQTCVQGGGDCLGYRGAKCDCDYKRRGWGGGCRISKKPPPNTACRCSYRGAWTCRGYITRCSNFSSRYCKNPDNSKNTCRLGGGDCKGY